MTNRHRSPFVGFSISTGRLLLVLAAVMAIAPGCRRRISSKPGLFEMSYFYSTPTRYHKVEIDSTALKYTYYVAPETLAWEMQLPCYADSELKTLTAVLSQSDLDELARVVNRSGFLRLPDTIGKLGGPICAAVLSAGRCWDNMTVVYLSGPRPQPFLDVAGALLGVVQDKLGRTIALPTGPPTSHASRETKPPLRTKMELRSAAFADGQPIPELYTGRNSPPLNWNDVPAGTRGFALTCRDLTGTHNNFIHWVAYGIPESTRSLPAGAGNWRDSSRSKLPGAGYLGPSPTPGTTHRYRFTLYALDRQPEFTSPVVDVEMLERAIVGHVLDSAALVGTYYIDPGFGGWTK